MATASVTYALTNGTTADASQVDTNFDDLVNFLNGSVVHKDGSVSMTGLLTLHAADPSTANHATRKSYVDGLVPSASSAWVPTVTQSGAVACTVNSARYVRIGPAVIGSCLLTFTGTGTASNPITVLLPVAHGVATGTAIGSFRYFDLANTNFAGTLVITASTSAQLYYQGDGNQMGSTTPTIAVNDTLSYSFAYLAA